MIAATDHDTDSGHSDEGDTPTTTRTMVETETEAEQGSSHAPGTRHPRPTKERGAQEDGRLTAPERSRTSTK
ncbi:hypothetical protein PF008_g10429 [Phytophthora fragariae]|uniref:Uncharacterized protein n=1 Tax=Phytophthora fragariae TaxID=53985 RepID=A0A6G0RTP0_9STRA|nr:hypothetical protein PF008_g10429 [Phytophthora fragariae]